MPATSPSQASPAGVDTERSGLPRRDSRKVYVAVGRSVGKGRGLLFWSFQNFKSWEVVLVHAHRPSPTIPTLLGNVPVKQAADDLVAAHRREEKKNTNILLRHYTNICREAKVKVSTITIENHIIQEGIVEIITKHEIRKLVMGAASENFMKVKKSFNKAAYISKNAPPFCEIWFVFKNKHVGTREVTGGLTSPASVNPPVETPTLPTSLDDGNNDNPSLVSDELSDGRNGLQVEPGQRELTTVTPNEPCIMDGKLQGSQRPIISAKVDTCLASSADDLPSGISSKEGENGLSETMDSENQPIEEVKHGDTEKANRTTKTRKLLEKELKSKRREKQKLLEKTEKDVKMLQKTKETIAHLQLHCKEIASHNDKLGDELELFQELTMSLKVERHMIRQQRDDARHQLEWWKYHGPNVPRCSGFLGFIDESSDFIEFSLSDLQTATCDFSESFKIGRGNYGCVYKGEMLDRSVTIKKLHNYYRQGQMEFQHEVHFLSGLKHPHLVTLIGACVEAWSVVCEYMPNGNLQDQLSRKAKSCQWMWKDRVRVAAEISNALLYMHSFKPEMVIHGDLKPENVLLDSNFSCKIGDYGICRLAPEDTLYCPSFRRYGELKGQFSYKDPEYGSSGKLTPKSDVYSLGLIILQLLTGRSPEDLASKVRLAMMGGRLSSVLDMTAGEWPMHVAVRLAEFGLKCCEMNSRDRPELTTVEVRDLEQLQILEEKPVPDFFLCPILHEIMHDPQVAADGFTYEGQAMRSWLNNGRDTSPMTNLKLDHLNLTPNHALRSAIQDWLQRSN